MQKVRQPKLFESGRCVYCGNLATTRDHTPPRTLLHKPLPSYTITVPACLKCNSSFSFDETVLKVVLASVSEHPKLVASLADGGQLHRAFGRDRRLKALVTDASSEQGIRLEGELLESCSRVIIKTAQGLFAAMYGRYLPQNEVRLVCLQHAKNFSLDDLVDRFRTPQGVSLEDREYWPEVTARGWPQVVAVEATCVHPESGEKQKLHQLFWIKKTPPVEWIDYQPGVFKFGFLGTEMHTCLCAIELWQTMVIGVEIPWPSRRGTLRRGRKSLFSREKSKSNPESRT